MENYTISEKGNQQSKNVTFFGAILLKWYEFVPRAENQPLLPALGTVFSSPRGQNESRNFRSDTGTGPNLAQASIGRYGLAKTSLESPVPDSIATLVSASGVR